MAAMNVKDYAETAKIAVMVGGGGLLVYLIWRSGLFQAFGTVSDGVGSLVDMVTNPNPEPVSKGLADSLKQGSSGLGSGPLWWLNPGLMVPGYSAYLTANQMGVKATSAYIVIRARDFDSQWRMTQTAYKAAVGMHKDNKAILENHVTPGGTLKPAFRQLVKTADFVIVYQDGSFKSA